MVNNSVIFRLSLSDLLKDLGYKFHSKDYFIGPDSISARSNFKETFRPDFYAIIFIANGWLDLIVNGKYVRYHKNYFIIGSPDIVVQRGEISKNCRTKSVFFSREFLIKNYESIHELDIFQFLSMSFNEPVQLSEESAHPILDLYNLLYAKRNAVNSTFHIEIIRNLIRAYVYETAHIHEEKGTNYATFFLNENDLCVKFRKLVIENFVKQKKLQFYADALFVTTKHLIKSVKKITGKTPGEIIDDAILVYAKVQLVNTPASIDVIAHSLNFADIASFSKFFKRHTGQSPVKYRNEYKRS